MRKVCTNKTQYLSGLNSEATDDDEGMDTVRKRLNQAGRCVRLYAGASAPLFSNLFLPLLLPGQDFLEEGNGALVAGLSQPEDGLFADFGFGVGLGNVDQQRHRFIF